jgi:hypothetical protein
MPAAVSLFMLGALSGTLLRAPAFILLNLGILVIYGWNLRHAPVTQITTDLLIGFLAVQCGYAVTILGWLLVRRRRSGSGESSKDDRS